MKKFNFNFYVLSIFTFSNIIYPSTNVTSIFRNTAEFPILFQSFQDKNTTPIETKIIESQASFTSNIQANSTVRYGIAPSIQPQRLSMSTGSKNIVYNIPQAKNQFAVQPATLKQKDVKDSYLSDTSVMQIFNSTTFPINISVVLKDAGQVTPNLIPDPTKNNLLTPDPIPTQALKETRLPQGGSYSTDDPITSITISCAVKKYVSQEMPLSTVKSNYDIVHEFGKVRMVAQNHKVLKKIHNV